MKNITYLESFFRKHNLSGKVKVRYSSPIVVDEFMKEVELENGEVINIHDIIFDIESHFPDDVVEQWLEARKENPMSLMDWIQSDNHYMPKDIDT